MTFIFQKKPLLKILFVAPEAKPFVKVGGLGEVMYSLPRALNGLGYDARVMIPNYAVIDSDKFPMKMVYEGLEVPTDSEDPSKLICNVKMFQSSGEKDVSTTVYFLENQDFYEHRGNVYGYDDDAARWALLSRGTLEFIRLNKEWKPDIIVACDWQGGLIPNYLCANYNNDPVLSKIATVFSIHNLHYQGMFDHHFVNEMDYDDGQSAIPAINDSRLLKINFMRRGIRYADIINTVSSTYAKEITTPEYGELLEGLLSERRSRLFGILNGIDYISNDPEVDPSVEFSYSAKNLTGRLKNKKALQEKFNLPIKEDVPVIGIVSRLAEQKGFDLLFDSLDALLRNFDFQLIVLGSGESKYLGFFQDLDKKYDNIATHLSYDEVLPKMIYSGADAILVPSRFEPCGLTQMEAMRYGAVPIVRKTGGLADSVEDYDPKSNSGTGFVFDKFDHYALFGAIVRAIEAYKYPKAWQEIQKRAMMVDFSWDKSAREYARLFAKATSFHLNSRNCK